MDLSSIRTKLASALTWLTGMGFLLTLALPAQAEIIDRVVARINDEIVTAYELRQAAPAYLLQRGRQPTVLRNPELRPKIYKEVLSDLVEQKLLLQEARKLDLEVTDEDVDQWLDQTRRGMSEEQFEQQLQQFGMSMSEYREFVRLNLLRLRITRIKVGSKVSVSESDLEDAYRKKYGEMTPKVTFITVSHILIQPSSSEPDALEAARKRALDVRRRIDAGESFEELAESESDGPSARKKGLIGTYHRGELNPEFARAAFALPVGDISEVVETSIGFHIIRVSKRDDRENPEFEEQKAQLREMMRRDMMERQFQQYIDSLRSKSFVEIKL